MRRERTAVYHVIYLSNYLLITSEYDVEFMIHTVRVSS